MFADRDLVDPSVADIVVDEFERIYRSAGARLAFLASARAIYLEPPFGRGGFYPRLAALRAARAVRLGLARPADPARLPAATSSAGCPTPSRSSSRAAATCRRSSARSARTACSTRFFARIDALGGARLPVRVAA